MSGEQWMHDSDQIIHSLESKLKLAEDLIGELEGALHMCSASAGISDPREACRVIIGRVREAKAKVRKWHNTTGKLKEGER